MSFGYNVNIAVPRLPELFIEVRSPKDLPPADVNGVIYLEAETAYYFVTEVDFMGARLVAAQNTVLIGASPELSRIKSTGFDDANGAFLTSQYTLPIELIGFYDFGTQKLLDIDGIGNSAALDWRLINFVNCGNIGTIRNVNNFVGDTFGLLNAGGLVFGGTIGTVTFSQSIFEGYPGTTTVALEPTANITRRFRVIYSAFVVLAGEVGISLPLTTSVLPEGYILDVVNFAGGGTYITGVGHTDNKSLFVNCRGISNTNTFGFAYFNGNTTLTNVPTAGTYVKVQGTKLVGELNERFSIDANGSQVYEGFLTGGFKVTYSFSVQTDDNVDFFFRVAKNGTTLPSSQTKVHQRTNQEFTGRQCIVGLELSTLDEVDLYVTASVNNTDILVSDFQGIVEKVQD